MKKRGIFAAVLAKNTNILDNTRHFLCFADCCIRIAVGSLWLLCLSDIMVFLGGKKGADSFLYIPTFHYTMPRNNEIRVSVKYSSIYSAPHSATTVSIDKFNIEKDAKNRAYQFILSSGYFHEFVKFCEQQHDNSFTECRNLLITLNGNNSNPTRHHTQRTTER